MNKKILATIDGIEYYESHFNGVRCIYRSSDGYINTTKICNDAGKDLHNYKNLVYFQEELRGFHKYFPSKFGALDSYGANKNEDFHPFDELKTANKLVSGQYFHPLLIHGVASWCSVEYRFKVAIIMNNINTELHLRNITLEQKIKEQEDKIELIQQGMKSIKGEIIYEQNSQGYWHIFARQFHQTLRKTQKSIPQQNALTVFRLFSYYAKHGLIKNVETEKGHYFLMNIEELEPILSQIACRKFTPSMDFNTILETNIKKFIARNLVIRNREKITPLQIGKLFEFYVAKKYNILPFSYTPTESHGLIKKDVGCDLLDELNKKICQCKYYSKYLDIKNLDSFLACIDLIEQESQNEEYDKILFISEFTKYSDVLENRCKDRNIKIFREKEEEFNKFIDELILTDKYWNYSENDAIISRSSVTNEQLLDLLHNYILDFPNKTPNYGEEYHDIKIGKLYYEQIYPGKRGEEIKEEFSKYFNPPRVKLTQEEKLNILTKFYNEFKRYPKKGEYYEGIDIKTIYTQSTATYSPIKTEAQNIFRNERTVSKRVDGLTNDEIFNLFEDFHKEYNRIPSTSDTNYKEYNIYRIFQKIKNSENRLTLRPRVMQLFYGIEEKNEEVKETNKNQNDVETFVKQFAEEFKKGVKCADSYPKYLEYCGKNKPLRLTDFRNEMKKYCNQSRPYKNPITQEINTLSFWFLK